jgi:hypothetical protein
MPGQQTGVEARLYIVAAIIFPRVTNVKFKF